MWNGRMLMKFQMHRKMLLVVLIHKIVAYVDFKAVHVNFMKQLGVKSKSCGG
jgi:hypothetical protein